MIRSSVGLNDLSGLGSLVGFPNTNCAFNDQREGTFHSDTTLWSVNGLMCCRLQPKPSSSSAVHRLKACIALLCSENWWTCPANLGNRIWSEWSTSRSSYSRIYWGSATRYRLARLWKMKIYSETSYCAVSSLATVQLLFVFFVFTDREQSLETVLCYLPKLIVLIAEQNNKSRRLAVERARRVADDFSRDFENPCVRYGRFVFEWVVCTALLNQIEIHVGHFCEGRRTE